MIGVARRIACEMLTRASAKPVFRCMRYCCDKGDAIYSLRNLERNGAVDLDPSNILEVRDVNGVTVQMFA